MLDLRQQLSEILDEHAAVVGVGNPDYGDDGAGVWLAEALLTAGCRRVFIAGATPENLLPQLVRRGFKRILLLDAVEFGGAPGAVVLLSSREIQSRFPQVSTHKISLGTLAMMLEQERGIKTWLLGIQPRSLQEGRQSEVVQKTVELIGEMIIEQLRLDEIPKGLNVNSPGWNPVDRMPETAPNPEGVES